jgi:hypothetical protein
MLGGVTDEVHEAPSREVHHGDAVAYLREHVAREGVSVVTSMPDVSETSFDMAAWRVFFEDAARACLRATAPDGVTVFFQTDLKVGGHWVSKSHLVMRAAEAEGVPMLWHKIVCRREVGRIVHGRPGFSHLLAFSREVRDDASRATPDVLPDLGDMPWSHSMGTRAADLAMRFIRTHAPSTHTVLVPFCGIGTALAIANGHGYTAIGIERNKKRATLARSLTLPAFAKAR